MRCFILLTVCCATAYCASIAPKDAESKTPSPTVVEDKKSTESETPEKAGKPVPLPADKIAELISRTHQNKKTNAPEKSGEASMKSKSTGVSSQQGKKTVEAHAEKESSVEVEGKKTTSQNRPSKVGGAQANQRTQMKKEAKSEEVTTRAQKKESTSKAPAQGKLSHT